jgi:hypothetical protein
MAAAEAAFASARRSPSYAAVLARGLLDPDHPTPAGIAGPNGKRAVKRYNVYRNNVTVSLIDGLVAIFPATQRITGIEFFRGMARFPVRSTPPRSPLLSDYGCDFPDFIAGYEYAQEMPYLADTAQIERTWLDTYHAADLPPLAAQALAAVPPSLLPEIVFVPHPATRIVRFPFPVVTIFAANRRDGQVEEFRRGLNIPAMPISPPAHSELLWTVARRGRQ